MGEVADKPATYADIEALPRNVVGEILFGKLVTHPRPKTPHGIAATSLSDELVGPFQKGRNGGPGGWLFTAEPELHLGSQIVVPDLAVWHRGRISNADMHGAYVDVAPDWICELLSDSTERYDRGDKRHIYAGHNVAHLWLLDPRIRMLEVFHRQEMDWVLTHTFTDTDTVSAPPFDASIFSLGDLWPFDPTTPSN